MNAAERRRRTAVVKRRRQRLVEACEHYSPFVTSHRFENPGRWRKQHPYDCGRPRCFCCHEEKVAGIRTVQDRASELEMHDEP